MCGGCLMVIWMCKKCKKKTNSQKSQKKSRKSPKSQKSSKSQKSAISPKSQRVKTLNKQQKLEIYAKLNSLIIVMTFFLLFLNILPKITIRQFGSKYFFLDVFVVKFCKICFLGIFELFDSPIEFFEVSRY